MGVFVIDARFRAFEGVPAAHRASYDGGLNYGATDQGGRSHRAGMAGEIAAALRSVATGWLPAHFYGASSAWADARRSGPFAIRKPPTERGNRSERHFAPKRSLSTNPAFLSSNDDAVDLPKAIPKPL